MSIHPFFQPSHIFFLKINTELRTMSYADNFFIQNLCRNRFKPRVAKKIKQSFKPLTY